MSTNEFGFQLAAPSGPQFSQVSSLNVSPSVSLPASAEDRLQSLMAYRLLAISQHRQALSDARTGLAGFHRRIVDATASPGKI